MEPTESELQEALASGNPLLEALAHKVLERQLAGEYHNPVTASRSEIDMSVVIATVATIDQNSVCEDPNCAQRGELMKDHHVVHKNKGAKKGLRGECPKCKGPMHNLKDDARLIAFACLWRQAFGAAARKTPVNVKNLEVLVVKINQGHITEWADRNLLLTVLAGPGPTLIGTTPLPKGASASTSPSTPVAPSGPGPSVTAPSAAPPASPAESPSRAVAKPDPEAQAKKRAALKAALRGAKVVP